MLGNLFNPTKKAGEDPVGIPNNPNTTPIPPAAMQTSPVPSAAPYQSSDPITSSPAVSQTTQTVQQSSQTIEATAPIVVAPVMPIETLKTAVTTTTAANPIANPLSQPTLSASGGKGENRREDVSVLSHLDSRASQVLAAAQQETVRLHQAWILPEQLLFGLLSDSEIQKLLENFSIDISKLSQEIQARESMGTFSGQPTLSDDVKQIFENSFKSAKDRNSSFIAPEDLLICVFSSSAAIALQSEGVNKEDVVAKLGSSAAFTEGRKTVLDKFGVDLTSKAQQGELDPVAGRDNEIDRLEHILLRRTKNNPLIIGEAGVGKTAIVEGLAQQIVSGNVPDELKNKKIVQIDVSSLVAGASHRGEFEERLRSVMRDAMSSGGQTILFIDEIHTLIGTGDSEGALDASNIIKPNLARGQLQIIGTTTTAEYRKYFEKDKAFARRFQPVVADEPNEETAIKMLQVLKPKYENFHHVTMPDEALESAVKLSKKYIGERYLPDKAVDLLDEAAAEVKLQHSAGQRQEATVTKSDIEKVVSSWTGIPITKLTEDESQKLLELDKRIHMRLIDQDPAVNSVAEAVRRGRIGLAAANRPIASFIFLGPTGTGKTELAKTLAEILFGRDDAMVRLDMSEYMEKHEVAKLIGAPPGYVGYEEGGQLTEAVRAKPYSIVLLDEVEKAHPDVFNILLQLLEDGRLTDNKGNTVSFKNTIIIATSNIGSQEIQEELSKPSKTPEEFEKVYESMQAKVSEELHKFFRPELLNRFDEIVMFRPLRQEDMKYIAKLGVEKTAKLLKEQGFELQVTDPALEILAREGYDQQYGARPLRRLIQGSIENPIAMLIINKTFIPGDIIQITYDEQKSAFAFAKLAPTKSESNGQIEQSNAVENKDQNEQNSGGNVQSQVSTTVPPSQNPVEAQESISGSVQQAPQMPGPTPPQQASQIASVQPQVLTTSQVLAPSATPSSQQMFDSALATVQAVSPSAPTNTVISSVASTTEIPVSSIPDVEKGVLLPNQPISTIDQLSPMPTNNAAVNGGPNFAPPAVAVAGLLSTDEETTEFA